MFCAGNPGNQEIWGLPALKRFVIESIMNEQSFILGAREVWLSVTCIHVQAPGVCRFGQHPAEGTVWKLRMKTAESLYPSADIFLA